MDWEQRRKVIENVFGYESPSKFDKIITQKQSMLNELKNQNEIHESNINQLRHIIYDLGKDNAKAEEEKKELIEAIKYLMEYIDNNYGHLKYIDHRLLRYCKQLLQKYLEEK